MAKRPVRPPAEMPYEQAFQELEAAVRQLESGERPLEEALALFERGQLLAARCSELLEAAELKLKTLVGDGAGVDLDDLEPEA
ncbi:MAG: exodeoxyribonuclease VII small subunit [Chloroflexi bacterium]|nr:exodeoxyribonuclease VII small subunit [Chloroflexota bacterium]